MARSNVDTIQIPRGDWLRLQQQVAELVHAQGQHQVVQKQLHDDQAKLRDELERCRQYIRYCIWTIGALACVIVVALLAWLIWRPTKGDPYDDTELRLHLTALAQGLDATRSELQASRTAIKELEEGTAALKSTLRATDQALHEKTTLLTTTIGALKDEALSLGLKLSGVQQAVGGLADSSVAATKALEEVQALAHLSASISDGRWNNFTDWSEKVYTDLKNLFAQFDSVKTTLTWQSEAIKDFEAKRNSHEESIGRHDRAFELQKENIMMLAKEIDNLRK